MGGCDTCTRKLEQGKCATLTVAIGLEKDCPFWSDDPEWREKAEAAIAAYKCRYDIGKE